MAGETVKINIPFEALLNSIAELSIEEKIQLRDYLDEQIGVLEEEENPALEAESREARDAYERGDYVTIDEYIERRQ